MPLLLIKLLPASVETPVKKPRVQTRITLSQRPFITSRSSSVINLCSRSQRLLIMLPLPLPNAHTMSLKRWISLRTIYSLELQRDWETSILQNCSDASERPDGKISENVYFIYPYYFLIYDSGVTASFNNQQIRIHYGVGRVAACHLPTLLIK